MSELSGKRIKPWWVQMGVDPEMPLLTPAEKEAALKMFTELRPKIEGVAGNVIMVGTAGDLNTGDDLKNVFYNPEEYDWD